MKLNNIRPYVAAIISNEDGKVLVQHHNKTNTIILVSGKVDEGETEHEALVREMREETGITDFETQGCYKFWDTEIDTVCTVYYVNILSGAQQNKEPTKHLWQDYKSREEILDYELPAALCLTSALERNNYIS